MASRIVRPHRIAEIPGTLEGDARTWEMVEPGFGATEWTDDQQLTLAPIVDDIWL